MYDFAFRDLFDLDHVYRCPDHDPDLVIQGGRGHHHEGDEGYLVVTIGLKEPKILFLSGLNYQIIPFSLFDVTWQ